MCKKHENGLGSQAEEPLRSVARRKSNSLYLLFNLISKEFKLKYRRSVLGIAWSILNPLLMMTVMALIFSNVFRFQFDMYPFAVYLILGQTFFAVFQDGAGSALGSIVDSASLIKKIKINKIIFPTEKVLFAVVNFFFSLIAVVAVMVFFGMVPSWMVILTPILVILLTMFTLGVGYIISALAVFFRDVIHLWGVLATIWFYFTPIFWPYEVLANVGFSWVAELVKLNPMYHFVSTFRQIVTGIALPGDTTVLLGFGLCMLFAVITLLTGIFVFKKLEKKFILYV